MYSYHWYAIFVRIDYTAFIQTRSWQDCDILYREFNSGITHRIVNARELLLQIVSSTCKLRDKKAERSHDVCVSVVSIETEKTKVVTCFLHIRSRHITYLKLFHPLQCRRFDIRAANYRGRVDLQQRKGFRVKFSVYNNSVHKWRWYRVCDGPIGGARGY